MSETARRLPHRPARLGLVLVLLGLAACEPGPQFVVHQRRTEPVPGLDGKVTVNVGDTERAKRADLRGLGPSEELLASASSLHVGDKLPFKFEGKTYTLKVRGRRRGPGGLHSGALPRGRCALLRLCAAPAPGELVRRASAVRHSHEWNAAKADGAEAVLPDGRDPLFWPASLVKRGVMSLLTKALEARAGLTPEQAAQANSMGTVLAVRCVGTPRP